MDLVRLENVHKTYRLGEIDVPVLRGISMSIERGELVALMGASGSGKTTLMNILGCLDRPTSGRYWIDGREISNASANQRAAMRNSTIGFVFQNFNLLPRTSALENVLMPLEYSHVSASKGRKRAVELLARLGLADRVRNEPSQLSGGQQQRVAIARSLINSPSLLLADEPTGALDSRTGEETLQLFQQLNCEEGITIVLVTHDAHVAGHADRVIHIRDGLIEEDEALLVPVAAADDRGGGHAR